MTSFTLYEKLKNAYEVSTHNHNSFKQAIESVNWDEKFFADNEYYFVKGDLTLTTTSLNPFEVEWTPGVLFADGSLLTF
jgi:hypothetical protein